MPKYAIGANRYGKPETRNMGINKRKYVFKQPKEFELTKKPTHKYPRLNNETTDQYILNTLNNDPAKLDTTYHLQIAKVINGFVTCLVCPNRIKIESEKSVKAHVSSQLHKTCVQLWLAKQQIHRQNILIKNLDQKIQEMEDKETTKPNTLTRPAKQIFQITTPADHIDTTSQPQVETSTQPQLEYLMNSLTQLIQNISNTNRIDGTTAVNSQILPVTPMTPFDNNWFLATEKAKFELRKAVEETPWTKLKSSDDFAVVQNCREEKTFKDELHSFIVKFTFERDNEKIRKKYKSAFTALAKALFEFPTYTLAQIQDNLITSHLLQYTKHQTVFAVLVKSLNYSIEWFYGFNDFKHAIIERRDAVGSSHMSWEDHLKIVWRTFYCAHPLTQLIYFITLTTGCRFEDLFRITVKNLKEAVAEDNRQNLVVKFGKTERVVARNYMFPDNVAARIRAALKSLKREPNDNLFAVRRNGDNKNKLRKFIAYQVDAVVKSLKEPEKTKIDNLQLHHLHSFRNTCYNYLRTAKLDHELVKQYMGWQTFGTTRFYDVELVNSKLKLIKSKISKWFDTMDLTVESTPEFKKLNAKIQKYTTEQLKAECNNNDSSESDESADEQDAALIQNQI